MTSPRTTALSQAHVLEGSGLANANAGRADIFEMTQAAEDAVLRPREPGAWSLPLRSALAARIARRNGEAALCDKYVADAANFSQLADPSVDGTEEGLVEVVSFTDKVATETKRVGLPTLPRSRMLAYQMRISCAWPNSMPLYRTRSG